MTNQKIIITGGTSGIGYELVKKLSLNNHIIVISRNKEKLELLKNEFNEISIYKADLSVIEETKKVIELIKNDFDFIDVLINNAAIQNQKYFTSKDFDETEIVEEINTNFTSICLLIYNFLPHLKKSKNPKILNINSGLALCAKTSSSVYCGTKAALNIFSDSLRYQLENTNIKVLEVFLELVDTNMSKGRGQNKIDANQASIKIISGLEKDIYENDIGKVKLLRLLLKFFPYLAKNIMKRN